MINQVIPFVKFSIKDDPTGEYLTVSVRDFPACFIDLVDHTGENSQACFCRSFSSSHTGIGGRKKRSATPRARNMREKPMLDGVVFGAIGRVVHHDNPHPDSVGESDEVCLTMWWELELEPPPSQRIMSISALG